MMYLRHVAPLGALAILLSGCVVDYAGTPYVIFGPYALPTPSPSPTVGAASTVVNANAVVPGSVMPAGAAPGAMAPAIVSAPPLALSTVQVFDGGTFTIPFQSDRLSFQEAGAKDSLNGEIGYLVPLGAPAVRIAVLRDPSTVVFESKLSAETAKLTRVRQNGQTTIGGDPGYEIYGLADGSVPTYYALCKRDGITYGLRLTAPGDTPDRVADTLIGDVRRLTASWRWK